MFRLLNNKQKQKKKCTLWPKRVSLSGFSQAAPPRDLKSFLLMISITFNSLSLFERKRRGFGNFYNSQDRSFIPCVTLTEELLLAFPREIRLLPRYDLWRDQLPQSDLVVIHGQYIYQEAPLISTAKKALKKIRTRKK